MTSSEKSNDSRPAPVDPARGSFICAVMRGFRRIPRVVLALSGLVLVSAALAVAWNAPEPEPEVEPFRRVTCEEVASLLAGTAGSAEPGEWVVVLASQMRLYADESAPTQFGQPFTFRCDDIELPAEGNLFPGSPGIAALSPSTLLVQPRNTGILWIERYCIACEDAPIEAQPGLELSEILRLAGAASGTFGLWLLFIWWLASPRSLVQLIGTAPTRATGGTWEAPLTTRLRRLGDDADPKNLEGPHWSVRGGEPVPADADDAPRLDLPSPGTVFRSGLSDPPFFTGPGQVNGLEVPAGSSTPLQHGDIVVFDSDTALELQTPDHMEPTLRYHLSGREGWRVVGESDVLPPRSLALTITTLVLAFITALVIQTVWLDAAYAALVLMIVATICGAVVPPLPALCWIELEEHGGRLTRRDGVGDDSFNQVLLVEHENGGYDLVVSDSEGRTTLTESSKSWRRGLDSELKALDRAMLEEARLLATMR